MTKVTLLKLHDSENWNQWVIGTPPAVPENSPCYSEHIQINYRKNPDRKKFLDKEEKHSHQSPIEEFYLVLNGMLELEIEDRVMIVKPREIIIVPPEKKHKIKDLSVEVEFLVIRAPISSNKTKTIYEKKSEKK